MSLLEIFCEEVSEFDFIAKMPNFTLEVVDKSQFESQDADFSAFDGYHSLEKV